MLHIENRNMKSSDFNSPKSLQFQILCFNLAFWIIFSPVNKKKGWFKLQTTPHANNGWIQVAPDSGWQDQKKTEEKARPSMQRLQSYFTQFRFIQNQI